MTNEQSSPNPPPSLESALSRLAGQVSGAVPRAKGSILVYCTDNQEEYAIEGLGHAPRVGRQASGAPVVRVSGSAAAIQDVLDGRIEASQALARGGIRVRGDLAYLESVLKDAGLLKCE